MKLRISLFLALSAIWAALFHYLIAPASTLIRQSAAVASVSNSNSAYLVQHGVENGPSLSLVFPLGLLVLAAIFFLQPISKAIRS